jgi:hypothetical protein
MDIAGIVNSRSQFSVFDIEFMGDEIVTRPLLELPAFLRTSTTTRLLRIYRID